jgi:UDP-2,4-diacetamido-2,4,6-trideoxy-beta-L-altropyranose hydrolase
MNIFFRVDSSNIIGTGHIMRCLNLAYHYQNHNIYFICKKHQNNINFKIPYKLFELESSNNLTLEQNTWLGESEKEDALKTIEILKNYKVNWLVIDHYSINEEWETIVKPYVKKILVLDDYTNRKHNCDLILNQQITQEEGDKVYEKSWCGDNYLLLNPKYFEMKVEKNITKIKRINIFMGGADTHNITERIINLLKDKDYILDVVVGSANKNYEKIKTYQSDKVNIYYDLDFLGDLFLNADICIGAPGATSYERIITKTMCLCICLAENQKTVLNKFIKSGAIKYLGMYNENFEEKILYWLNYFNENIKDIQIKDYPIKFNQNLIKL